MRLTSKFTGIADKEEMSAVGARILEEMDVCSPYVRDFAENGTIYLFKNSFGKYRQKNRSKTFEEVAEAMAQSWG